MLISATDHWCNLVAICFLELPQFIGLFWRCFVASCFYCSSLVINFGGGSWISLSGFLVRVFGRRVTSRNRLVLVSFSWLLFFLALSLVVFSAFGFVHKIATFEKTAAFQVTQFLV